MSSIIRTLGSLLSSNKRFIVPVYQRGYIWGKSRNAQKNSVEYMLDSILVHMQANKDLFIQGITVCETDSSIEIIDGQQRITFFYLLLKYLNSDIQIDLDYPARSESRKFLRLEDSNWRSVSENATEPFQDIYYFKKTIRLIRDSVCGISKVGLSDFVQNHVKFLYINLPQDKAISVFTMMNGNKASMLPDELIKAELLRLVSLEEIAADTTQLTEYAICWEQNLLRSKYAREWDKWLYWWNQDEVRLFYHTKNGMNLLIKTYFDTHVGAKGKREIFNFENFRCRFLTEKLAKKTFYELRCLQKRFEDVYHIFDGASAERHNQVGAILTLLAEEDRTRFLIEYFGSNSDFDLKKYYKLVFLGLSHTVILSAIKGDENCMDIVDQQKQELLRQIRNDNLYFSDGKENAYRQLLRRNVEEDSRLKRAFDFSIWGNRSLEHIFPKSQVYHMDKDGYKTTDENDNELRLGEVTTGMLNRSDFGNNGSEHCIGNLVLLHKDDNSRFGAKSFDEKKTVYFDLQSGFRSRHLLHTVSVFARKTWGVEEIQENKKNIIQEIICYYDIHETN